MNCNTCHELIQQRFDGLSVATLELERHLAECSRCGALHAASLRLSDSLRRLAPPCPPLDLTRRIVAGVRKQQRAMRRRRVAFVALAASLIVATAAVGWYYSRPFEPPPAKPQVAVNDSAKPDQPSRQAATTSVRETVTEAGNALAALTTRTADETVGQSRLLVPVVTGPALDEFDMPPALEPTKSYLEAGQGVTVALEPVTNSARRAVALFRRDLPHVEPEPNP